MLIYVMDVHIKQTHRFCVAQLMEKLDCTAITVRTF